jgi:YVTN family beta-propeller protein
MDRLKRFNRIAALAILPLMALAVVVGAKAAGRAAKAPLPREGVLIVAQLRGDALRSFNLGGAGETTDLALPGPPHEFLASGGRLYLTLGRADRLLELEPGLQGVLRSLPLSGEPNGIARWQDELLVTLDKGNAVVHIDPATMAETSRDATGDTPHNVAVAGDTAYVTDARDNTVRAIDVAGARPALTVPAGLLPESIAVVGDYVVTADADGGTITIIRRDPFATVGTLKVGSRPVRVVALDATHVAVALNGEARVAIVDVAKHSVEKRVDVLGHPDGMCLSPGGGAIAVVSNEAGAVQLFRLSDWAAAGTLEAGDGPGACTWLAGH